VIATLLQLALLFGGLSLIAFGGGAGTLPDMQRAAVDVHHWITAHEFLDLFAISRTTPGPGSMIVVLIGQSAAGVMGGAVAFLGMFGPSSVLAYVVGRFWHRAAHASWRALLEQALAPVAIGLTFASGLALMRGTEHGWPAYTITIAATLAFAFTRLHPVFLLAGGAVLSLLVGG